jgi:hypothetical protein
LIRDEAHWQELQRLFDLCAELPEAERTPALHRACPDPALRERVLALLAASATIEIESSSPPPPIFIGPYRIVREVGAGGLGVVYLVERLADGVRLRSALKMRSWNASAARKRRSPPSTIRTSPGCSMPAGVRTVVRISSWSSSTACSSTPTAMPPG